MLVGEPEYGFEVTGVSVNPPVAEITGPHTMIENTKTIYTEKIDITALAAKETISANFRPLNKLLTITEKEPVQVTVFIEPMQMEKLFEYKEAGEYEVELIYSVPSYFTLKDDAPQSIRIKIDKKPEEITEPLNEVTE